MSIDKNVNDFWKTEPKFKSIVQIEVKKKYRKGYNKSELIEVATEMYKKLQMPMMFDEFKKYIK